MASSLFGSMAKSVLAAGQQDGGGRGGVGRMGICGREETVAVEGEQAGGAFAAAAGQRGQGETGRRGIRGCGKEAIGR